MTHGITLFGDFEISRRAAKAHEMKNCMSVILAVATLVEGELSSPSRARIGRLRAAAQRLRGLLAEDLDEEVAGAWVAAQMESSSVKAMVESAAGRVEDRAANARVKLLVKSGGGQLRCDKRALGEAVVNLLTNAIEASPAGECVCVVTHETPDGDQLWVVQDAGKGISAGELARLGQPFCSTKATGSGLGLALARSAVAAHGGLLRVESRPGGGTTVCVWLPNQVAEGGRPKMERQR
jgi:signal transduction histidine kinase